MLLAGIRYGRTVMLKPVVMVERVEDMLLPTLAVCSLVTSEI
ncbi:hypothetical protein LTSERUB_3222 [Salmonella enterica subsp. enterica serovar Rubislaw str. A4-653]|uniref:Uncharacterized protein n=1 Tax=Salmonella enterica subsp. enterica serovar Rubislaw str. A4-653 TaxID=913081 RepID=G5QKK9_SALRU|nr:hypothetical protein LTSERUB_3222 [Salmonella enterica subsp. enterica serovar Rubislaw str. A4-653]